MTKGHKMFELKIQGSGQTAYTVKQGKDGVVYCSCPAWRFQKVAAAHRSCKHLAKAAAILQGQLAAV
jgi:predicted nucleic acid-binding Zn finger protein